MSPQRVPLAREAAGLSTGEAARTIGDHLVTDRHIRDQQIQGTIFAELTEAHRIESDFKATVARAFDAMITWAGAAPPALSA